MPAAPAFAGIFTRIVRIAAAHAPVLAVVLTTTTACRSHPTGDPAPSPPPALTATARRITIDPSVGDVHPSVYATLAAGPMPASHLPSSPLFVDSRAGRVYASGALSGTARAAAYDARTGALVASVGIEADERLLGVDRAGGLLAVWGPVEGVRWLDGATLAETARVPLPTAQPDAATDALRDSPGSPLPPAPLLHPLRHAVVLFDGRRVRTIEGSTGAEVDAFDLPVTAASGPILHAALSDDGRILYTAAADTAMADWVGRVGAELTGFDMARRVVIDRRHWRGRIEQFLAWDTSLLVTGTIDKDNGSRHGLWVDGRERRRVAGSALAWRAVDRRRGRLIGTFGACCDPADHLVVADAATLDVMGFVGWDLPEPAPSAPWADDATTGELFVRAADGRRLYRVREAIPQQALAGAERVRDDAAVAVLRYAQVRAPATGEPLLYRGFVTATVAPGTPEPDEGYHAVTPVARAPSAAAWHYEAAAGGHAWPEGAVAAATTTLFGRSYSVGVVRSDDGGRSWRPGSAGIDALQVRELHPSPAYARDRTIFAASFNTVPDGRGSSLSAVMDGPSGDDPTASAWRSTDGGQRWMAIGRLAALTVSPSFATDRTVAGFDHLGRGFRLSTDAGTTWQARGALPPAASARAAADVTDTLAAGATWLIPPSGGHDRVWLALAATDHAMGGGAQWPLAGTRLYASFDDGWTWAQQWAGRREPYRGLANVDAPLLASRGAWVLPCVAWLPATDSEPDAAVTLASTDGGRTWTEHLRDSGEGSCAIAARPDGAFVLEGVWRGAARTVSLSELVEDGP